MAKRGTVHQDIGAEEDLATILKKSVPAVEFEIAGRSPLSEQYESGELIERLRERGLFVDDDRMGHVFVGTTPENLVAITNAKTPFEFGRAHGYPRIGQHKRPISTNEASHRSEGVAVCQVGEL